MKKTLLITALVAAFGYNHSSFADTEKKPIESSHSSVENAEMPMSTKMPASLLDNVLLPAVATAQASATTLQKALESNQENTTSNQRSQEIDEAFTHFVRAWKMVQASYIAGELDRDMIDTPRLIDTYHNGKENLFEQLTRIVKKEEEAEFALFKNTFKSINALDFYLYADNTLSDSEREYAIHTIKSISTFLDDISNSYTSTRQLLLKNSDTSISYVLNSLIDSSYKLKEWRIGDPSGNGKKYKDKPDNSHQEYPFSHASVIAIAAILDAHDTIIGQRDYINLGSAAIEQGAIDEVAYIRSLITGAKEQVASIQKNNIDDFSNPAFKKLYETVATLNDAYYVSLIKALPVQAKILDADGD